MKKWVKKSVLLLVSLAAMAAFAMPSLVNAATWSAPGAFSGHSPSLVFTEATALGASTVNCTAQFAGDLVNTAGVAGGSITSLTLGTASAPCTGGGIAAGCTNNIVATGLPWAITTSATTLTISGISANVTFVGSCPTAGWTLVMNGSFTGTWVNGAGTANTLTLANAGGLAISLGGSPFATAALDGVFSVAGPHL